MNGYLLPGDDAGLPSRFFRRVYNGTKPRPLYRAEWEVVKKMTRRTLQVRGGGGGGERGRKLNSWGCPGLV